MGRSLAGERDSRPGLSSREQNQGWRLRYATIRKHILPALFSRMLIPGSREEEMMREVEKVVRGHASYGRCRTSYPWQEAAAD